MKKTSHSQVRVPHPSEKLSGTSSSNSACSSIDFNRCTTASTHTHHYDFTTITFLLLPQTALHTQTLLPSALLFQLQLAPLFKLSSAAAASKKIYLLPRTYTSLIRISCRRWIPRSSRSGIREIVRRARLSVDEDSRVCHLCSRSLSLSLSRLRKRGDRRGLDASYTYTCIAGRMVMTRI